MIIESRAEALSDLMTICARNNVRGRYWAEVESAYRTALETGHQPADARDHALRLMRQLIEGEQQLQTPTRSTR